VDFIRPNAEPTDGEAGFQAEQDSAALKQPEKGKDT
jgi:hypothetical protein